MDLTLCEHEPIHVPGAIQPHGILLVVDPATDCVLQASTNAASYLGHIETTLGRLEQLLGITLNNLLESAGTELLREPTYLGTVAPPGSHADWTITAHHSGGVAVVEMEPAVPQPSAVQALANIRSIAERIGRASDHLDACTLAAAEVRRITGYDRVMIYQFLPDGSGAVVAEVKDAGLPSFLNHRYPASDIPKQARELYRRNPIRVIPDVGYKPSPVEPATCVPTHQQLDMSHCFLRSVSPVHIRYLKNMDVGASMSVSLLPKDDLWGLIACHNVTPKHVPYETQEACRHVGQILSQQIRVREEAAVYRTAGELGNARDRVLRALVDAEDPGRLFLTLGVPLATIAAAHGVAVCSKGDIVTAGRCPTRPHLRELADWLTPRLSAETVLVTDCLSEQYPAAAAFTADASGLLAAMLPGDPTILMWFRAEQVEEIKWAGNPHEPVEPGSKIGALNPRKSFTTWEETVRGRSRPWNAIEVASVREFSPRAAFILQQERVRELNRLLEEANERLASLASTDGLTGIANRRAFDEQLSREWTRAARTKNPIALVTLDIDYFKQYNDLYGHLAGDHCLRRVATAIQDGRRVADFAARTGGEEFAILLPGIDLEGALVVAERVRTEVANLNIVHEGSPLGSVTASFGVAAAFADRDTDGQSLMQAADDALYQAKRRGRNRVAAAGSA